MLSEFLFYLVGILAVVGGILLLERIVAGPHSTAGTGYARVDSAFDFDRLRRKQFGPRVSSVLRRGGRPTLPLLQEVTREPRQLREAGEQFIPVASIVGSVDGASHLFDRNFRPVSDRARARLGSVLVAMRQGEPHSRLVMFEPPTYGQPVIAGSVWEQMTEAVDVCDRKRLVVLALNDVVGASTGDRIPEPAFAAIFPTAFGQMLLDNALAIPTELRAHENYRWTRRSSIPCRFQCCC
jgi:hypothetical protein